MESPFECRVLPSPGDPSNTLVYGEAIENNSCPCGENKMLIQLYDASGFPVRGGGHDVKVALSPEFDDASSAHLASPLGKKRMGFVEAKVEDHGDGYYTATYTVTRSGDYNMWARVGGWLVKPPTSSLFVTDLGRQSSFSPTRRSSSSSSSSSKASKPKVFPLTAVASFPRKIYVFEGQPHVKTSSLDLSRFQTGNVENYLDMATSAGVKSQFSINLRDKHGNFANCENNEVEVSIQYSDSNQIPVDYSVTEKKVGVYCVDFKPQMAGEVVVTCTMKVLVDDTAGGRGGLADPYDHRYSDGRGEAEAGTRRAKRIVKRVWFRDEARSERRIRC